MMILSVTLPRRVGKTRTPRVLRHFHSCRKINLRKAGTMVSRNCTNVFFFTRAIYVHCQSNR